MARFIRLFVSYYPRWREVTFQAPASVLRYEDFPIGDPFPRQLKTLEIKRTFGNTPPQHDLVRHLLHAPTLQSLHLHDERMFTSLNLPVPFPNLTRLVVTGATKGLIEPKTALQLLRCCSHTVRTCFLDMTPSPPSVDLPLMADGPVKLPHLERLDIKFRRRSFTASMVPFFQSLEAPKLNEIGFRTSFPPTLATERRVTEDILSFLPEFLRRSGCDLTLASLTTALPVDGEDFTRLVEMLPFLRTLKIVSDTQPYRSMVAFDRGETRVPYIVTRGLLERLTPGSLANERLGGAICPHLQHVHFKECDPRLYEHLLEFAESRINRVGHLILQSFNVDFWMPLPDDEDAKRRLRVLRDAGVDVRWRSRYSPATSSAPNDRPRAGLDKIWGEQFLFPDGTPPALVSY